MNLFDLELSKEDSLHGGVEGDIEEPLEFDDMDFESNQISHLSAVLNTIDSLESARATMSQIKDNDLEFSPESVSALGLRVSMAYNINGVQEDFPIHVSTEAFQTMFGRDNGISVALEQMDHRIGELSTEANNWFARFWRNTKDVFGREFNRIDRLHNEIGKLISEIENSSDWGGYGDVTVKNAAALTVNGKIDTRKVNNSIREMTDNYLSGGKFMANYFNELDQSLQFFNRTSWSSKEDIAKQMKAKNFFKMGKPLVETRDGDSRYTNYKWNVSDLNSMVVPMPTGMDSLIPPVPYDSNAKGPIDGKGAKAKESYEQTLPRMSKEELVRALREFQTSIGNLPNSSQFNSITGSVKKQMEMLAKTNVPLKNHQRDQQVWNGDDWTALAGAVAIPMFVTVLLGGAGLIAWSTARSIYSLSGLITQAASGDAMTNVNRNDMTNRDKFLIDGLTGVDYTLLNGLIFKRYANSFENKVTLFFIGLYREAYAILKSTGNAYLSYGYACLGKSNKY